MEKTFTIKTVEKVADKFLMVKLIKDFSGMGLIESKYFLDSVIINNKPNQINLNLSLEEEKEFLKRINEIKGIEWIFNNMTYKRQLRLVQLGLIDDKQELVDILKKEFNITIFLDDILNALSEDRLIELFKQIPL
jgi:hypothetical protein